MQLLVSVADEHEIPAAVEGGADIIDIKNPAEGSLGAASPSLIATIRALTPPNLPVSAAIGDAPMLPGTIALASLGAASCGVQYVKIGLRGTPDVASATTLLAAVREAVAERFPAARVIAAGYADAASHGAILPHDVPKAAARAGVHGCMLDTLAKGRGTLLRLLSPAVLDAFLKSCRDLGLESALAGSIAPENLPHLLPLNPDIIGVRSAVCGWDRAGGRVTAEAVARFKSLMP